MERLPTLKLHANAIPSLLQLPPDKRQMKTLVLDIDHTLVCMDKVTLLQSHVCCCPALGSDPWLILPSFSLLFSPLGEVMGLSFMKSRVSSGPRHNVYASTPFMIASDKIVWSAFV